MSRDYHLNKNIYLFILLNRRYRIIYLALDCSPLLLFGIFPPMGKGGPWVFIIPGILFMEGPYGGPEPIIPGDMLG